MTYSNKVLLRGTVAAAVLIMAHAHVGGSVTAVQPRSPFQISMHQVKPGEPVVEIQLANTTREPITVYEDELPWRKRHSADLYAIVPSSATPLKQLDHIDEASPAKVTLKPGVVYSGTIDLRLRFVDIERLLSRSRMWVFWSYQAKTSSFIRFERQFGGCELAQR